MKAYVLCLFLLLQAQTEMRMFMVMIDVSSEVPDNAYFRTNDVAPVLNGATLMLLCGKGMRRKWGSPGVNSCF